MVASAVSSAVSIAAGEEQRQKFRRYVAEVATVQNRMMATRIDAMADHQKWHATYFFVTTFGTVGAMYGAMYKYGPRHFFKNPQLLHKPFGPACCIGVLFYMMIYHVRNVAMKARFWQMVEDFQRELKRVDAHHVPEGLHHMTMLETLLYEVKCDRSYFIDTSVLREPVGLFEEARK